MTGQSKIFLSKFILDFFSISLSLKFYNIANSLEKQFVIYKYQECLTNEEIAEFFSVSIQEVSMLEERVLSILKSDKQFIDFLQTGVGRK